MSPSQVAYALTAGLIRAHLIDYPPLDPQVRARLEHIAKQMEDAAAVPPTKPAVGP